MDEPRINVYTCQMCRKRTVTVDVDEGVTPFMIVCDNGAGKCKGGAVSAMYPRGPKPAHIPDPTWKWYKPTGKDYEALTDAMKEHVDKFGLDIRRRTSRAPIMHGAEISRSGSQ